MRPAFKKDGTITAANASSINDGAAVVILCEEQTAKTLGLPVLARIKSYASGGVDPEGDGHRPDSGYRRCLEKASWNVADLDLIEANEAFAAPGHFGEQILGMGHQQSERERRASPWAPIGASGCRILVTLLHEMKRQDAKKGLATLCIGGGMGVALAVERD